MTERLNAARSMREGARKLRQIATDTETKLSAQLLRLADEMDKNARELETAFLNKPPKAVHDGAVA